MYRALPKDFLSRAGKHRWKDIIDILKKIITLFVGKSKSSISPIYLDIIVLYQSATYKHHTLTLPNP